MSDKKDEKQHGEDEKPGVVPDPQSEDGPEGGVVPDPQNPNAPGVVPDPSGGGKD